jgi:hypothetical protein
MKFLDRVKMAAGILAGTTGAGRGLMESIYAGNRGDPPARGTQEFLAIYETNPWVRGVAGKVAKEVGITEWTLERNDRANASPVPTTHPLYTLLNAPNPFLGRSAVYRVTQLALDLVGDMFLLKQRNALGLTAALWPIPPHWVAETPTPSVPFYRVAWRSWQAILPESELLWIHDASPLDPYRRGSGIIRALGDEIETDEYASKHAKQLFFNRARPDYVVMDPGAGEAEIRIHERAWMNRLQGLFKAHRPYFANRELKFWQPTEANLENLTLVPLRTHERDIQLQCWGMPPEQMGIVTDSNRSTIDASDYIFQRRLIEPRRQFLAEELTLKLAVEFDPRIVIEFVSTVPEDKDQKLAVMKAAPWAWTMNEWREFAGDEPVRGPEGESRLVPLNSFITDDLLDPEQRPQSGGRTPETPPPNEPSNEPPPAEGISSDADEAPKHYGANGKLYARQ